MRVPSFIAEMGDPKHRPRLHTSVRTGYFTVFGFLALALLADHLGVVPFQRAFLVPMVVKLATNTAAFVALRRDRWVLETATVNVSTDMFTMTAVIYFTGGELSPLFPIYLIEITVVALLGNVGVTVLCAVGAIVMYSAMAILVRAGALPPTQPPVVFTGGLTGTYVVVDLAYAAFVLGVPTLYAARILQDLRAKQKALEERTRQLVEAGQQKSQFMANVTHELRTPIHGICGLSDLLESGIYGPVTGKQKDAQQSIKRSARSLLALIDDLLELSRADAGKLEVRPEPVDVAELVATVAAAARWMVGTKALTVETDVAGDLPRVESDPRALKQVLVNLLSNAAKFTEEGGRVVVRARPEDGGGVRLEVEDTGIGIAPADQARIWEEFRQLDGSAERTYGGVGLGLAVVKRLAHAVGARVELKSEPGKGSTFAVLVPAEWKATESVKAA
ncbi:MAG TPA: HAMP domain-containing sensor histidine kinase [Polyangiaceae bacterium]|jgi:signal transduction histidine kinase